MQHLGAFVVGIVVGFLGGLFGKGGSAIATPLLSLIGYPGFIAVASPLPATIPGTLIASGEYWQSRLLDWQIVWWSIAVGIPATILGSLAHEVHRRAALVDRHRNFGAWVRPFFLVFTKRKRIRGIFAGSAGGKSPGLLAGPAGAHRNRSWNHFGTSGKCRGISARAGLLTLPQAADQEIFCLLAGRVRCAGAAGTVVHAYLGHISWTVTGLVALGSVPFSYLGARIAIRTKASRLERLYGLRPHRAGSILPFPFVNAFSRHDASACAGFVLARRNPPQAAKSLCSS